MCNPRRIRVRATRELAETWAHEVRRQVTRSGQVGGQAQVAESLAGTIGGPTIGALTNVLAQLDGWTEYPDGTFRHELDGGEISFDPATLELVITATVSAEVSVTEEASQLVEAQVSGPVEAEGEGVWYDDEWMGHTEARAEQEAERDLARAMDAAVAHARDEAAQQADAVAGDAVQQEAQERVDERFAAAAAAQEAQLRRAASDRLLAIGAAGRALFNAALAQAYRDAILAYAMSRRASNLHHSERDGVLDIEFELEV